MAEGLKTGEVTKEFPSTADSRDLPYQLIAGEQWQNSEKRNGRNNNSELLRYADNGARLDLIFNFMSGEPEIARISPFRTRDPEIFNAISERFGVNSLDIKDSESKWLDLSKRIKTVASSVIERELGLESGSLTKLPIDSPEAQKQINALALSRDIHEEYPRSLAKLLDKINDEKAYMAEAVKLSDKDSSFAANALSSAEARDFFDNLNRHYGGISKDWKDLYHRQIRSDIYNRNAALENLPKEARKELDIPTDGDYPKGILASNSEHLRQSIAVKLNQAQDSSWGALAFELHSRKRQNAEIKEFNDKKWGFQDSKKYLWPGLSQKETAH